MLESKRLTVPNVGREIGLGYVHAHLRYAEAMAKYGRMLGFGAPTGIDLPYEASGIMPDPLWKLERFNEPWTLGNTYHASIGQGFVAVTPLQLLNAYAAVANGGTLYRPYVVATRRDADGEHRTAPVAVRLSGHKSWTQKRTGARVRRFSTSAGSPTVTGDGS